MYIMLYLPIPSQSNGAHTAPIYTSIERRGMAYIASFDELTDVDSAKAFVRDVLRLPELGEGSYRTVFALDENTVIKLARRDYAKESNRVEVERSQTLPDDAPIARVIRAEQDGTWLMMERVEPYMHRYRGAYDLRLEDRVILPKIRRLQIGDAHAGNFGYTKDNRLVMIDYAN